MLQTFFGGTSFKGPRLPKTSILGKTLGVRANLCCVMYHVFIFSQDCISVPRRNWDQTIPLKAHVSEIQSLAEALGKEKEPREQQLLIAAFYISYGSSIASNTAEKHVPIYYSALKKAHKERKLPVLREEDIEESFVRGVLIAR
jgi:hypothetical protein